MHPEKAEWANSTIYNIPKTPDAIRTGRELAKSFVDQCRKSSNSITDNTAFSAMDSYPVASLKGYLGDVFVF